jgi:hypothetical protein
VWFGVRHLDVLSIERRARFGHPGLKRRGHRQLIVRETTGRATRSGKDGLTRCLSNLAAKIGMWWIDGERDLRLNDLLGLILDRLVEGNSLDPPDMALRFASLKEKLRFGVAEEHCTSPGSVSGVGRKDDLNVLNDQRRSLQVKRAEPTELCGEQDVLRLGRGKLIGDGRNGDQPRSARVDRGVSDGSDRTAERDVTDVPGSSSDGRLRAAFDSPASFPRKRSQPPYPSRAVVRLKLFSLGRSPDD